MECNGTITEDGSAPPLMKLVSILALLGACTRKPLRGFPCPDNKASFVVAGSD
ncbi:hypothetical protein V7103_21165 [Neobacillus drentensis]|uniref:hypothetical protein n=1 Tax=Neobacillus drentensis TaxID=220684 RepID=UPI003000055C